MIQILVLFCSLAYSLSAQTGKEVGPEGFKLFWFAGFILAFGLIILYSLRSEKLFRRFIPMFTKRKKILVSLQKDRLYYPDLLELIVTNTGNTDVDIDKPVLIFSSIWLKRKFILKGSGNYQIYPLYLTKGQRHKFTIDLNQFYRHDKSLKKLPVLKVLIYEVDGKRLGSHRVLLRKTLFSF